MPIETMEMYYPKMMLPVYTHITRPGKDTMYEEGEVYHIRVHDEDEGDADEHNYVHQAVLIGKWETTLGELPDSVLGFNVYSNKRSEALERMGLKDHPKGEGQGLVVLTFLQPEKAHEFVMRGLEVIEGEFTKKNASVEDYQRM